MPTSNAPIPFAIYAMSDFEPFESAAHAKDQAKVAPMYGTSGRWCSDTHTRPAQTPHVSFAADSASASARRSSRRPRSVAFLRWAS